MSIKNLMKDIRKRTGSTTFKDSKYGEVSTWISTGDYGLNRIISGDIYKGIPSGKVVLLGGESQSGKSFIAANLAADALNNQGFDMIFYFDSEGGALNGFFESRGCDTEKVEHILVDSVEDATVKILSTYNYIVEFKKDNPDAKFLCILDSLGELVPDKLINDAVSKGRQAQDMGLRAKLINNMVKGLTIPAIRSDTAMVIVNHVYDDPASLFPSKIKNQGGGKGIQYTAHLSIQCAKRHEKSESSEESAYKASVLRFFTVKNRMVKPFFESEMFLDFSKGPMKYFGLLEPAKRYGFVVQKGAYYVIPSHSDKNLRLKAFIDNDEIWATFLDDLNDRFKQEMSYSGNETEEELDQLMEEQMENVAADILGEELETE
jgi:RecA/RadA recombinase